MQGKAWLYIRCYSTCMTLHFSPFERGLGPINFGASPPCLISFRSWVSGQEFRDDKARLRENFDSRNGRPFLPKKRSCLFVIPTYPNLVSQSYPVLVQLFFPLLLRFSVLLKLLKGIAQLEEFTIALQAFLATKSRALAGLTTGPLPVPYLFQLGHFGIEVSVLLLHLLYLRTVEHRIVAASISGFHLIPLSLFFQLGLANFITFSIYLLMSSHLPLQHIPMLHQVVLLLKWAEQNHKMDTTCELHKTRIVAWSPNSNHNSKPGFGSEGTVFLTVLNQLVHHILLVDAQSSTWRKATAKQKTSSCPAAAACLVRPTAPAWWFRTSDFELSLEPVVPFHGWPGLVENHSADPLSGQMTWCFFKWTNEWDWTWVPLPFSRLVQSLSSMPEEGTSLLSMMSHGIADVKWPQSTTTNNTNNTRVRTVTTTRTTTMACPIWCGNLSKMSGSHVRMFSSGTTRENPTEPGWTRG